MFNPKHFGYICFNYHTISLRVDLQIIINNLLMLAIIKTLHQAMSIESQRLSRKIKKEN